MPHIKKKYKLYTISIALILIILFSGYTPFFNEYFYESFKKFEQERKSKLKHAYNPLFDDFLNINSIDDPIYNFNAKGKCYILADVNGIDFTSFKLDDEEYNVSYGLNAFPKDFGDEFTSHTIEFDQIAISDDYFKWLCVEPLFIAQDNITVNLEQETTFSFYAGGPISILMQPNFSYNWLYLELDGKIINDIYDTTEYPEIESSFYSYFIEDGAYLQFDLDMQPKVHTAKIKGNGSIEYKILVNLDWDEDLIQDVDEIQKELFYDKLDPTIPNIWGCYEQSSEFSYLPEAVGNNTGFFHFYIPKNNVGQNFLSIALYSGKIFDIVIDNEFLTYKNILISANYMSNPKVRLFGKFTPGHHFIEYKFDARLPTEISFIINAKKILVLDKAELKDSDGDGLKDQEELANGLNPYNPDTDQDLLPDDMDSSPLMSLKLNKHHIHQIVLPHDGSKDSIIQFTIKKPVVDYSTNGIARKWHNYLDVNILLVMRVFGNTSTMRDALIEFWKGDKNLIQEYSLIEGYDCKGVSDAIPHPKNPFAEYNLIYGSPSLKNFEYELKYPKRHPAKKDNAIDIRFDFLWLVTQYDSKTGNNDIIHFYEVNEDLILESMVNREYGRVSYIIGSPDSMIENQILWAITQNPQLKQTLDYDISNDIKFQGETDYLNLGAQLMIDRGIGVYPAKHGFEDEDLSSWTFLGQDGAYFDIIDEFKGHTKVLSINDICKSSSIVFPRAEQSFDNSKYYGNIEFWFATSDRRKNYTYILLSDLNPLTGLIKIGGYDGEVQFYQRGFYLLPGIFIPPMWITVGYIESNKWHHMRIEFNYPDECLSIFLDGTFRWWAPVFSSIPSGGGFKKISFAVYNEFSMEKSFYVDAVDYSWDANYKIGRNKKPLYDIDDPDLTENEVIYIGGFQKNSDILHKISMIEKFPYPSEEILNSRDFTSYGSYYSISNLNSTNDYSSLGEEVRGDQKVCYTNIWYDYSEGNYHNYEQRTNLEGYPIHLQVLEFQNSNVLKLTQVLGSNIPLNQIPHSLTDQLHDKISLLNQTYLEQVESDDDNQPIHFDYNKDIYKEIIDTRPWEIESSKLIFSVDPISFADKISEQIISFKEATDNFIKRIDKLLEKITKKYYKSLLQDLAVLTFPSNWKNMMYIDNYIKDVTEFNNDLIKIWAIEGVDNTDAMIMSFDLTRQISEAKELFEAQKLMNTAKKNAVKGFVNFIDGILSLIKLYTLDEDNEGVKGFIHMLKLVQAWTKTILGALTVAYSGYIIIKGLGASFNIGLSSTMSKVLTYAGKCLEYFGYFIQGVLAVTDIIQAIEIYKDVPGMLYLKIIEILILNIGLGVILPIVLGACLSSSWASYGLSLVVLVVFLIIWPFIEEWYADVATPEMEVIEEESGLILPTQNIKKHGGLEVGDPIKYRLVLKNTGGDLQRTFVRAKFKVGGSWERSAGTGFVGKWKDHWEGGIPVWEVDGYSYSTGQKFDHTFTAYIPESTGNLYGYIVLEIGGAQEFFWVWWRTANIYGPEMIDIDFSAPVLQTTIEDFFADTREISNFKSKETLEAKLRSAMIQYKWKEANQIIQEIKQFDPTYHLDLPINTNIDANLKDNVLEIDPSTGELNTNFDFNLEGWDNPLVDYNLIAPEGFSITPNYFPKQSLLGYQGTHNFDYEMKEGYYYGTYDFNYEMEEGLYYGTYDFRDDKIGGYPDNWTVGKFGRSYVRVEESVGGHKKVVRLYDRDNRLDETYAQITQNFEQSQSSGAIEYWFRTDDAAKTTFMTIYDEPFSEFQINLVIQSNTFFILCYYVGGPGWDGPVGWVYFLSGATIENDKWYHFKVTFECGWGGFDGLPADSFSVYINGIKWVFVSAGSALVFDQLPFSGGGVLGLDKIAFFTHGKEGWYSSYFDAIGYSWDDWSHEGLGYQLGWNANPYNLISLMKDGWNFNPKFGCSGNIIEDLGGHKNVLDLYDYSGSALLDMTRDIFPIQSSGSIELWWRVSNAQKGIALGLGYDSLYGPRVYIRSNEFHYYDGSYHIIKSGALANTWYHIRIDFECGSDGYEGLLADSFYIYINGIRYGPFPFHNPLSTVNELGIWSSTANYGYHAYFDAIGYSWDTWSHDGLGYKKGRNINPFDIEPLLKDGFDDIQLKPHFTMDSIVAIPKLDGHDNVIAFNHLFSSYLYDIKLNKFFDSQKRGTIEWWMRTDNPNHKTILGIGSNVMMAFSHNQIAYYTNGWFYTGIPVYENTWYHLRIDFECGSGGYMGLSANSWDAYVNGVKFASSKSFSETITSIDFIYIAMKYVGGDIFLHSYFDGIGFSWDSDYEIGRNLNHGLNFNLSATNPEELIAGTYYFKAEIRLNETGELIFFDQIPFQVPLSRDLEYSQSNIIFRENLNLKLNQSSPIYTKSTHLNIGNIFNIKCKTNTSDEIMLDLLYNGQITKQFLAIPRGNLNFEDQFIQIFVDKSVSFNQLRFTGNLEDDEDFILHEILIMNSLITTPSGELFNPINLTNNGNVPEFIAFSFSGVPFDFVDTSLYPDEFQGEQQVFMLIPGESKICLFRISEPVEPMSNMFSREIIAKHPITNEMYLSYIDNFRTDGIYIDSPKNITYYNFGAGINSSEEGILLNIITEEELVWIAYSLDNQPQIEFSGREIIQMPEKSGSHKIQVFGKEYGDNLFISKPRYFSVEYPLKISIPENTTYYEPMGGYYLATYGFENEKAGTSGTNIDFIDSESSTGGSQITVLDELDGHKNILSCHNTQYGMWQMTHYIENAITIGTIEFYWRTNSLSVSPWIFSFLDWNLKWGTILYQNKMDGGDLWYWDKTGFHDLNLRPSVNTWHHFRIYFNTELDSWDLSIDGRVKGIGLSFYTEDVMNMGYIHMQGENRNAFNTYYDAIGFSWDDNYNIGDNKKEGLLLSYSSKAPNIDQLKYSIDDQAEEPFSGETVIPLPKNGLHSIKFNATRSCGKIIQSEVIYFTVARSINIITPESKLYTSLMYGYYRSTYGFENNDLSPWINVGFRHEEIIPFKKGHFNVLHLKNVLPDPWTVSPAFYFNAFPSRTSGTIELWHYPDYNILTDFLAPINHIITLGGGNLYIDSYGSYMWQYKSFPRLIMPLAVNRWNHISFNFQNGIVYICVNNFFWAAASIGNIIDSFGFIEPRSREMWVDGIGYSWDPNYNIGDNKKDGLLLSFNAPSDIIFQNIKYSLDGQNNITISGNTIIPQPTPGTHSIQVFGTDLEGYLYESELRYFSFLKDEIPTPAGMNVKIIDPKTGIEIVFTQIITSGTTKIDKLKGTALSLPIGFQDTEQFYDITTSANYQGTIFISIPYNALLFDGDEEDIRLYNYVENIGWVDITTNLDTISDIIYGETSGLMIFAILEPDTTPPVITIDYHDGDKTDGNPGIWNVIAHDLESDINYDTINVTIDGQFAGNEFGDYPVPNTLGEHTIFLEVQNNNIFKAQISSKSHSIVIGDDDTTYPEIGVAYYGGSNDSCPGYFEWKITDKDSGLSEIILSITYNSTENMENYTIFLPGSETGVWYLPPYLGNYTITMFARDNDNDRTLAIDSLSTSLTRSKGIIDDDIINPSIIDITYETEIYDSSSDLTIEINTTDRSGISEVLVDFMGIIYTADLCNDLYITTIPNPVLLGEYNFTVIVWDADNDRFDNNNVNIDKLSTTQLCYFNVIDDDIINPSIIDVIYDSIIFDSTYELNIEVNAIDASGISEVLVDFMGSIYPAYLYNDLYIANIPNPIFLGEYNFTIIVWDADNDRFDYNNVNIDRLSSTQLCSFNVIDDDILHPELSNLMIIDDILELNIAFTGLDDSSGDDQGLSEIYIFVDDELILPYNPSPTEFLFEFSLPNNWIMQFGTHHVNIMAYDADDDRIDDSLLSSIEGTFEITFDEMEEFVIWEINQLIEKILESPDDHWQKKNSKSTMCNKLNELKYLILSHNFEEAYDKLLHDIKPKLTGLKTDENEEPWDGGVFKNPWVINNILQEEFRLDCNEILTHIPILNATLEAINGNLEINYAINQNIKRKETKANKYELLQFQWYNYYIVLLWACVVAIYLYLKRKGK
ncbi:MAG: hypothetical protein WBH31_15480 [Promethearchaeia archaeon]